eukprot:m.488600 g.488600  ORF g.488600 m.488600 type:complete len:469 (+) comp25935_c0_seq1:133-1539(+)
MADAGRPPRGPKQPFRPASLLRTAMTRSAQTDPQPTGGFKQPFLPANDPRPANTKRRRGRNYTPVSWEAYFDREHSVPVPGSNSIFHVYEKFASNRPQPSHALGGPVVPPPGSGAGGGGSWPPPTPFVTPTHTPTLSPSTAAAESGVDCEEEDAGLPPAPVVLMLHGGGHSALSWAVFSQQLANRYRTRLLAMDLRGHGKSTTDDDEDLSRDTLCDDVAAVVRQLLGPDPPPIALVGHSLGGAIAVHVAHAGLLPALAALVVIDVVEGSAMDALSGMVRFLRSRPQSFDTVERAVEWSVRSGQLRNVEAARVSMPPQLVAVAKQTAAKHHAGTILTGAIMEEDEEGSEEAATNPCGDTPTHPPTTQAAPPLAATPSTYTWKVDLEKSEPHWRGWFQGLSQRFLAVPVPKLLLLAGIERLDTELTIGQMQGKFQMGLVGNTGHSVHEDAPERAAQLVSDFFARMRVFGH